MYLPLARAHRSGGASLAHWTETRSGKSIKPCCPGGKSELLLFWGENVQKQGGGPERVSSCGRRRTGGGSRSSQEPATPLWRSTPQSSTITLVARGTLSKRTLIRGYAPSLRTPTRHAQVGEGVISDPALTVVRPGRRARCGKIATARSVNGGAFTLVHTLITHRTHGIP
jgi:hypothetical protein